jgi:hypothetical protein
VLVKLPACLTLLVLSVAAAAQEPSPAENKTGLTPEDTADAIVISDATPVALRNIKAISSKESRVGDVLKFEAAKPVTDSGLVVIPKGAIATVRVTVAEPAHRKGKGGRLEIAFESIEVVGGQTVPLHGSASFKAGGQLQMVGDMLTAGIYTMGLASPFVLFEKGREAYFFEGERFVALLSGEVRLSRAYVAAHQPKEPEPRNDIAVIYVIKMPFGKEPMRVNKSKGKEVKYEIPWKFTIGQQWYRLRPSAALRIELPPGRYFLNPSNKSLRSAKPAELVVLDAKGGESYFFEYYYLVRAGCRFRPLSPETGAEMLNDVEAFVTLPVEKLLPLQLRDLQVQRRLKD